MSMSKVKYLWLDRKYLLGKRRQAIIMWVAWHLPHSLVTWCYFRVGAHATTGKYGGTNVCDLSMMDAIKRWDSS